EELIRGVVIRVGVTVARILGATAPGLELRVPLHVIGHDEVEPAVIIYINPGRRNRPQLAISRIDSTEMRLLGYILEGAVSPIVIQNISVYSGYEDVRISVVVVITDGHAHGITLA